LNNGAGKMHNVLAPLRERVQSYEKSVSSNFPLILRDLLILEIAHLELSAYIESLSKLIIGDLWLFTRDESKDGWSINIASASINDSVADLSYKDN